MRLQWGAVLWLALSTSASCGVGDGTLADIDPGATPVKVSYADHVQPRVDHFCTSCHNPDGPLGNAGGWNLSSYELVRGAMGIIRVVVFDEKRMPPGGARRMSARDQAILSRWEETGFAR